MPVVKIIGGHGHVALHLARELSRKPGFKVVSLFRNPDHEAEVASTGAVTEVFDVEHAGVGDFTRKLAGADFVVWSAGAGGKGGSERTYAIDRDAAVRSMQATRQSGPGTRYIMVSYLGSDQAPSMLPSHPLYHYGQAKHAADQYLQNDSGLDWTIVNPGRLNFNDATGLVDFRPSGREADRSISRANVGLIIATIISNEDAANRTVFKQIPCLDGETPIENALSTYK